MSRGKLESIEKLRKYAEVHWEPWDAARERLNESLDKIEQEIAERYIELPVDADGVPIRLGDTVREVDDRVPMEVMSLTFYEDCVDVNACGMNPNLLRHVKYLTIEDAISDAIRDYATTDMSREEIAAKYAEEIRGMMA